MVVWLLYPFILLAQGGRVFDNFKIGSKIFNLYRKYGI